NFKLDRAQKLLQTTDMKLDDICDAIGYSDTTQFIRDFKKKYEITPAKYRKQFLQEASDT
ncbi:MAG: helix-turn-helix domain-containing protein, partial [Clostridia bacterium]|nr:helix-turn-helix domain-containing protein [Clostridia bacterium]